MKVYKLTTEDGKTRVGHSNETQWGEGVTHTTDGHGVLCGPGWLHFYYHPILAVIFNPCHAVFNLSTAKLWEAEAEGELRDDKGRKGGCTSLTTLRVIDMPKLTIAENIAFGILCAKSVYKNQDWQTWADNWLNGSDRTYESAFEARNAAAHAAYAYAAADADAAAADAADDAAAYYAADYAAADAATYATDAATHAAADDAFSFNTIIAQWEAWRIEESTRDNVQ